MGHRAGREGFDVSLGAAVIYFFVPTRKGGKEDEGYKSEDYGDDSVQELSAQGTIDGIEGEDLHKVRKDDRILKCTRHPYQIQGILIHRHLPRQRTCIVAAQKRPSVRVDADTEVAYAHF